MATNKRNEGSDYQSWEDASREQRQNDRDSYYQSKQDEDANSYLKNHPSASWAEAKYKTSSW